MNLLVAGAHCTSVSTDTRAIEPGALFVALQGPNHDGHDHVLTAFERGAAAAVVERFIEGGGPQLVVSDSLAWLQQTAATERERWGGVVVAITGSAGKTTTKDATAAVVSTLYRVGKTAGNYNNHIGLPLSILNLAGDTEVAVLEIGMNHAGEIAELARIAKPDIAVVINVGSAHIENLGSIEQIALAKRELIESLGPDGIAVLNGDDERVRAFAAQHPGRTIFYGTSEFSSIEAAHVRASNLEFLPEGSKFDVADVGSFFCPLPARGGLMAALAALAAAKALKMDLTGLKDAIASLQAPKMRLARIESRGMVIWDDCYNSNPEAAKMMLDLLADTPAKRRIAVLGEMLELGRWSEDLHREVGTYAARRGISVLVGIRGAARHLVDAGLDAGLAPGAAHFFPEPSAAGRFVKTLAESGDALLFKGSRGTRVELALQEFLN
ncbi:UDP-N-acetylmuramoyl-tripeptide--D-alanyl-D-alanine ligase [Paludibaculum fermentans]|uniref:UDP-N-acetylmuramoyl-tripeptide--D-alanyl-D-alanine ligase n=1 Tax=Paludibaculum fermentans TaxID=1473598 RepID=A0A7S7NXJ1_PALFE|nr:UDP-N-acetylmuramoyl-tripeptide--D-alanyl-D-alanine ligase [Paludibaculum fermentans]QOY91622.1 UDP-N-acetylmuramoyl-tripeptide--D-alanyl-D-alanine ligase [Paludibaculum fermentans]